MDQKEQGAAGATGPTDNTPDPAANAAAGAGNPPAGDGGKKKEQGAAGATGKVKPVSCKCVTKCHFAGRLYRVGDVYVSSGEVPDHFKAIE